MSVMAIVLSVNDAFVRRVDPLRVRQSAQKPIRSDANRRQSPRNRAFHPRRQFTVVSRNPVQLARHQGGTHHVHRCQPLTPPRVAQPSDAVASRPGTARSRARQSAARSPVGPGGAYNVGNLIGLCQGIVAQTFLAGGSDPQAASSVLAGIAAYFAGNAAAVAMTVATVVFIASGEAYHRAWSGRTAPHMGLNRLGDFLSGLGAVALGIALLGLGHPVLALTSGLLHALGKFGSAAHRETVPAAAGTRRLPDLFRSMVLVSRVPAFIAAGLDLHATLQATGAATQAHWSTPATLIVCYAFWSWADLLLFKPAGRAPAAS